MKLMSIVGSPRKGGNTELLIDQVIAGCKSKTDVDVEKFFIVDKQIEYCTGCLTCVLPSPGTGKCAIEDDMADILDKMKESDAFIFGTPNHMRTITAPLLNFLSRMLPLMVFETEYDDKGNRIGGEITTKIQDKAVAMVIRKRAMTTTAPRFILTLISHVAGLTLGTAKTMIAAGTSQFTTEGIKRWKKVEKPTIPFCHTIRVVMSPKGLKAPPALAATTILIQAKLINLGLSLPMAMTTAHMRRAVVRLSATGEIQKARRPVIQKIFRYEKPAQTSLTRKVSKTSRSSMALI